MTPWILKKIKAIVELVKESGIAELEITEGEEKLKISALGGGSVAYAPQAPIYHHPAPSSQAVSQPSPAADAAVSAPVVIASTKDYITSPMVGTFYGSSAPSSPPFVTVGQVVKSGQVLCIIEAMKLMNQIESDKDGVIKEILVKDGDPVEFGQQLFVIG